MPKAIVIPTEGAPTVLDTGDNDETEYDSIRNAVGGWLDSVSTSDGRLVGYVHDEGLLIGLPVNAVASMMFDRPLVGTVVVVGGLNEQGEYDGASHDVPEGLLSDEFSSLVVSSNADTQMLYHLTQIVESLDLTPKVIPMTDDEFAKWLDGDSK